MVEFDAFDYVFGDDAAKWRQKLARGVAWDRIERVGGRPDQVAVDYIDWSRRAVVFDSGESVSFGALHRDFAMVFDADNRIVKRAVKERMESPKLDDYLLSELKVSPRTANVLDRVDDIVTVGDLWRCGLGAVKNTRGAGKMVITDLLAALEKIGVDVDELRARG